MAIRLSAADWCFARHFEGDPASYYRLLKRAGFEGAEMVPVSRMPMAREAGLALVNMSGQASQQVGWNRAEHHLRLEREVRDAIGVAKGNGVGQLILFSGNKAGQAEEEGIAHCVAGLKRVAAGAERAGVVLTLEVFNTHDHKDYAADSGLYAFEVVRGVGSPAVKVLYDAYHMARMGEDVTAAITRNLDLIAHLHVAGVPGRDYPKEGEGVDYRELVRAVNGAGYPGYWGMEFLVRTDATEELTRVARQFAGYAA